MYIWAKLIFVSYQADKFERGMMFRDDDGTIFQHVYSTSSFEEFIKRNGYPVKPYIISIPANRDDAPVVLATPDQIGWWDDAPWDQSDDAELRDVELKDFNYILEENDGILDIEVSDHMYEQDIIEPVIYMDKVTIRDTTGYTSTSEDDYEDWDDMDDLTDDDHNTE